MKTSTYEQTATDFLTKNGIEFSAEFIKHDFHFDGDTDKSDIYKVTFSRNGKKFSLNFGQSIANSCDEITKPITDTVNEIEVFAGLSIRDKNISASVKFTLYKKDGFELSPERFESLVNELDIKGKESTRAYNAPLISKYRHPETSKGFTKGAFEQCISRAIDRELKKTITAYVERQDKIAPSAYDVIACLTKYDPFSFENFCSDFGYDTDSRSAERTYKAVKKEWNQVSKFFTPQEIEEMQEIQ